MDRHDIPDEITAEHVAQMHQEDLKVEHLFGCKGLTYWCDVGRRTAFCLIEAPNRDALTAMHRIAHGEVPNQIIEVDPHIVESFLGRIEDPEKTTDTDLNIIDDPAFRVLMMLETSSYLDRLEANQLSVFTQKLHKSINKTLNQYKGRIVKQDNNTYLASFVSVTNAVLSALKIQADFKYITPGASPEIRQLHIGLSAGTPVTDNGTLFGEVISTARNLCEYVKDPLVVTHDIKVLYENENRNARIDPKQIRILKPKEERFLNALVAFCENSYADERISIPEVGKALGCSKSQLYRRVKGLSGKSPNRFLREFRLQKALELLHRQTGSISEIAYETGFNNPAYFTKCFSEAFGILPSRYVQQHAG